MNVTGYIIWKSSKYENVVTEKSEGTSSIFRSDTTKKEETTKNKKFTYYYPEIYIKLNNKSKIKKGEQYCSLINKEVEKKADKEPRNIVHYKKFKGRSDDSKSNISKIILKILPTLQIKS